MGPPASTRGNDEGPAYGGPFVVPVGIVYLCSTNSINPVADALRRELSGSAEASERDEEPRVKRTWNRLSDRQRVEVAHRYESGDTTTQLAKDYGVAKSTIIGILRDKSVVVRRQPMTPEQVSEAARIYESGLSLSRVAAQLNVNQETMRAAIIRAGVQIRPATGA